MKRTGGGSECGITYDKAAFTALLLPEATGQRTCPPPGTQNAIHRVNPGPWEGVHGAVCRHWKQACVSPYSEAGQPCLHWYGHTYWMLARGFLTSFLLTTSASCSLVLSYPALL